MTITVKELLYLLVFLALVALSFVLDRLALPGEPWLASLVVVGRHAWWVVFSVTSWFEAPRLSRYYVRFHRGLAALMIALALLEIGLDLYGVWTR